LPEIFLSALKVLVVEDDKELAAFVRTGLEDEGFNVTLALMGALAYVRPKCMPLILLF